MRQERITTVEDRPVGVSLMDETNASQTIRLPDNRATQANPSLTAAR